MYYSVISLLALLILLITNHDERKEELETAGLRFSRASVTASCTAPFSVTITGETPIFFKKAW